MSFKIGTSRLPGYIKMIACTRNIIEITVVFENFYYCAYNKDNKLKNSEVY